MELHKISISWSTIDVDRRARSLGYCLSFKQTKEILNDVEQYHDAESGINLDTIGEQVEMYCEDNNIKESEITTINGEDWFSECLSKRDGKIGLNQECPECEKDFFWELRIIEPDDNFKDFETNNPCDCETL